MKRLRPIADEALVKSNNQPVPIKQLPQEAMDLMGLTSVATMMLSLNTLSKPLPACLSDFPNAFAQVHVKDDPGNKDRIIISYGLEYKTGKTVNGMSGWTQEKKP